MPFSLPSLLEKKFAYQIPHENENLSAYRKKTHRTIKNALNDFHPLLDTYIKKNHSFAMLTRSSSTTCE